MLETLSSSELTEWIAFFKLNPWGTEQDDFRSAMICSVIANVNSGKGKSFSPHDFMPKRKRQSMREQQRMLEMALGKSTKRKGKK